MSINVIVIPAEGPVHEHTIAEAGSGMLADMQAIVGGYIEAVNIHLPGFDGPAAVGWLNEDGKGLGLPYNEVATVLCRTAKAMGMDDVVVGPFFITGPPDSEGDVRSIDPALGSALLLADRIRAAEANGVFGPR